MSITKEQMSEYYAHVFPVEDIAEWISYSKPHRLVKREFCFTMIGDVFTRFRSYSTPKLLRDALVHDGPEKIDIGAVYSHPPSMKQQITIVPQERELVFDIDMSDYDSLRSCCKGKAICRNCWPWMASAARILRSFCTVEFGFKHFLTVFSGRRGLHMWVCDNEARMLSDEERSSLVSYMNVFESSGKLSIMYDILMKKGLMHPTLQRMHDDYLRKSFNDIFLNPENANYLGNPRPAQVLWKVLSDIAGVNEGVRKVLLKVNAPTDTEGIQWETLEREILRVNPHILTAIRFVLLYPRLDEKVSTRRDHLLKLPFCIHPGTGSLCVPLTEAALDKFDPLRDPPKLSELLLTRSIDARWQRPLLDLIDAMRLDAKEVGEPSAANAPPAVKLKEEGLTPTIIKKEAAVEAA